VIKTFKCKETEGIYEGRLSRRLSQDIQRAAARKLEMLSAATRLESLKVPPGNKLEKLAGIEQDNTVFASTSNGGYVSCGRTAILMTSRLWTIIEIGL